MTKRNTKSNVAIEIATIPLKVVHDDILKDNVNSTLTTKIMRTWLRVHMRDAHNHNSSWMFTSAQRHDLMMKFNPKYRATIEREQAKANKPARKPRAKKDVVASVVVAPVANEPVNA